MDLIDKSRKKLKIKPVPDWRGGPRSGATLEKRRPYILYDSDNCYYWDDGLYLASRLSKVLSNLAFATSLLPNKKNPSAHGQNQIIDWSVCILPLDIYELICRDNEVMLKRVLKKFSAASIIWHHWQVFFTVQHNGSHEGMNCDDCGNTGYCYKRVLIDYRYNHSTGINELPLSQNDYSTLVEPQHTWYCRECYPKHKLVRCQATGHWCSCRGVCYY